MNSGDIYIGSQNTLCDKQLNQLIKGLIKEIDTVGKDPEKYIEYHNIYTIYTTLLLFYATGHRPVIDPFCYLLDIDAENGHILIDDKTITEKHRFRLTVLPDIACNQIKQFTKHLRWLIYRLKNYGQLELCNAIDKVLDNSIPKTDQLLPFLFLIKNDGQYIETISISESVLEAELKDLWPITLNQSRHNISTFLRDILYTDDTDDLSLRISNIETHLGHMEQLKHPFGRSSLQSFSTHKETLTPYLDNMMNTQGWSVINAKKYGSTHIQNTENWTHNNLPLGPINREITRERQRKSDITTVRNILTNYETEDFYKQKILNKIRDQIVNESANSAESINRRLNILFRFLSRIIKNNKNVKLPTNYIALAPEPSPFTSNTIPEYIYYKDIQRRFLSYLADNGRILSKQKRPRLDYTTRAAEIIISAVLFDSVYNKNTLNHLSNSNFEVIYEAGKCFVDLYNEDHTFYSRWIPGNISLALLHGFNNDKLIDKQKIDTDPDNIYTRITSILHELGSGIPSTSDPIDDLLKKSTSYSSVAIPGFLNAITSNQITTKHLPQSTILRIIRNERLVSDTKSISDQLKNDSMPLIVNNTKAEYTYTKINQFIKDLENDLNTVNVITSTKNQNVDRIKRHKLVGLLNKRINQRHQYPPIAVYVASWVKKLCQKGTDLYTPMLKFSVIDEYARMIAKSVCFLLYDLQHLDLDAEEYEYIYEIALESKNHADKTKFKNNLADFHNFLVTSKVADPIDWEPINDLVSSTRVTSNVDANIISPKEYDRALRLIQSQSNKDRENSEFLLQCCAILILGYRFGLRVSEAIHLEYKNIQHDDAFSFLVIHITNNRYKTTKSIAGRRTIPLIGKLSETEKIILSPILSKSPTEPDESNIFVDEQRENRLIDYSLANKIIKQSLVLVTGDTSIRYHHLRHSFANRILVLLLNNNNFFTDEFSYLLNDYLYVSNKDINNLLTGQNKPSNRSLTALATLMGHSSISTTFENYIHVTDNLLHTWSTSDNVLEKYNKKSDTDYITSYTTGALLNYVKKGRQKKNIETTDINKTLLNFINHKRFSTSSIITEISPDIQSLIKDTIVTKRQPDLLEIDSAITLSILGFHTDHNKIASRLYLDTVTIDNILDSYQSLTNQSLYDGYFPSQSIVFNRKLTKEDKRIRAYVKHNLADISETETFNTEALHDGLEIWSSLYHPHKKVTGIVISNPKDFFSYLHFLSLIGVNPEHLKAYIPSKLTHSLWYKVTGLSNRSLLINNRNNDQITIDNLNISKNLHHSFTKQRFGTDYRIQVVLDTSSSHSLKYQMTLDRLCFLLLLHKSLQTV